MRVNVYAEEMTDRIEIIGKEIDGHNFTGLRLYLELPVTLPNGVNFQGPFMHRPGDDDSAAITFWGKRDLRWVLLKALSMLDEHYAKRDGAPRLLDTDLAKAGHAEYVADKIGAGGDYAKEAAALLRQWAREIRDGQVRL